MRVIDVDSYITVIKRTPRNTVQSGHSPDGRRSFECNNIGLPFTPPADRDRDGIETRVLIFRTSRIFYGPDSKVVIQTAHKYNDALAEMIAACRGPIPLSGPGALTDAYFGCSSQPRRSTRCGNFRCR
jgi:hypothetical protein